MTEYPANGMVPVHAGDILNLFRWLKQRPQFYKLADWNVQIFFKAEGAPLANELAYDPIEWEAALEWAQSDA